MASGARKWLVGCGIGCGLMILAVGGIGTCGFLGIQKIKQRADNLDQGYEALVDLYGRAEEYAPAGDGVVPAARMEVFLAVRADLAPTRDKLGALLADLDEGDSRGGRGVLTKIRAGMSLLPSLFDFIDERNQVLLDQGMGLGEYLYIYGLGYYAWLGKDPGDGPSFTLSDHDQGEDESRTSFRWNSSREDPGDVRESRRDDLRRYLNGIQAPMLAGQLEAARLQGLDAAWLVQLEAEQAAVEASSQRLMWQDGLPEPIAAGLEPFRDRLEAAYSPVMNVVEMGLAEND